MVLDPIPQSLPVHFFGSRPQPPTSLLLLHHRQHVIATATNCRYMTVLMPTQYHHTATNVLLSHRHIIVTRVYLHQHNVVTSLATCYCHTNIFTPHDCTHAKAVSLHRCQHVIVTLTHCRHTWLYSRQHTAVTPLPTSHRYTNTLLSHDCTHANKLSSHRCQHIIVTPTHYRYTTALTPTPYHYTPLYLGKYPFTEYLTHLKTLHRWIFSYKYFFYTCMMNT